MSIQFDDIVSQWWKNLSGTGSEIRRMFILGQEKLKQNPRLDLIDLSLGNPDLEPPVEIKQGLLELIHSEVLGTHRYMDNAGFQHVRDFIAAKLSHSEGVALTGDSVYMSCGAAGGLQIILRTILDPGDEVILFAPYFVEYLPYTIDRSAVPIVVDSDENHVPLLGDLEKKLSAKTRAVMLNSPNNPTGVVYSEKILKELSELLLAHRKKHGRVVHLISDEPYARLAFKGTNVPSVLKHYDAAWMVRSHSKDLGLAGERIGYMAWGPALALPQTLNALKNSARAIGFPSAPALMQRLIPKVFEASVDVGIYETRVNQFIEGLKKFSIHCVKPGGGFFIFPKSPVADDRLFCERLVEHGVLSVPGAGFGKNGYFRLSLTQTSERLESAVERIGKCVNSLKTLR